MYCTLVIAKGISQDSQGIKYHEIKSRYNKALIEILANANQIQLLMLNLYF